MSPKLVGMAHKPQAKGLYLLNYIYLTGVAIEKNKTFLYLARLDAAKIILPGYGLAPIHNKNVDHSYSSLEFGSRNTK